MEMKKLVLLALTALVAIPVFAQDEESNRVYTSSSGKAFIELVDHIGYGYHFIQSNDFTPAWSGEWFLNLVKFGIRPADVLGIDLGIDMAVSNFSSTQNAFTQVNQLIKKYEESKKMLKQFNKGKFGRYGGFGKRFGR